MHPCKEIIISLHLIITLISFFVWLPLNFSTQVFSLTLDLRSNEKLEFENTERCEWSLSGIHIERILGGSVWGGVRKGKC